MSIVVVVRPNPAPDMAIIAAPKGDQGDIGFRGWSPVFAAIVDGERRVLRVMDWTGGEGIKPTAEGYVGTTGLVADVADALDVRGPQGPADGEDGLNGWTPLLGIVDDGARRVQQVIDWTGGTGAKPTTGLYVGAAGLVATAALAADIRGAAGIDGSAGLNGWTPILAIVNDGARRVQQVADWTGGTGDKPAPGLYVGAAGFVATAVLASDIRGAAGIDGIDGTNGTDGTDGDDGLNGWSPVFAAVNDGARRVLQVSDWAGGTGAKPATGKYVGAAGLVDLVGDGVDVRGPQGVGASTSLAGRYLYIPGFYSVVFGTALDFAGDTVIERAFANGCELTAADFTGCSALIALELGGNALTTFSGAGLSSLTYLDLNSNAITTFYPDGLSALTIAYLNSNALTALDLTGLTALTELDVESNALTTIDLTGLTALATLQVSGNQLTTIDLTGLTALSNLYINSNSLSAIDLTDQTNLLDLYLANNSLTTVDLVALTSLTSLNVDGNSLSAVDLTGLTALSSLNAANNLLTAIDLTGLASLTYVYLGGNALTEAVVDDVLSKLDAFGISDPGAFLDLSGGTNAPPSAAGVTSKSNLEGKGWTVVVNS